MKDIKIVLVLLTAPLAMLFALSQLSADYTRYSQVRDFGERGTAIVQSIEPTAYWGGQTLSYMLDLRWPSPITGSAHLSRAAAARYTPGQEIAIVYAATDPTLNALSVAQAWTTLVSDLIVFGAYCTVLALAFALLNAAPPRSWRDGALRRRVVPSVGPARSKKGPVS